MSIQPTGLPQPEIKDYFDRIKGDTDKGMSLEAILADTQNLIREFEWTIARSQYQVCIYKDLIRAIQMKMYERDHPKKKDGE